MEYLLLIGSVTLIHLLAVMSPGPDFLIVMKHSLGYSRQTGIWTAVGIGLGISIHILYCFVGLGIVINNSPLLYNLLNYAGAIYIFYLGIMSFPKVNKSIEFSAQKIQGLQPGRWKAIRIGFLTNVLNPKATLFFLSLFTLVIAPTTPGPVMAIISFILVFDTMIWFIFLSYIITIGRVTALFNRYQYVFNRIFGVLLILVAIQIAFS